jgi:tetrahydromethanopterin S-methyltransferase subunit E
MIALVDSWVTTESFFATKSSGTWFFVFSRAVITFVNSWMATQTSFAFKSSRTWLSISSGTVITLVYAFKFEK